MQFELNKVTWYSKILTLLVFLLAFPMFAFYVGSKYEKVLLIYSIDASEIGNHPSLQQ